LPDAEAARCEFFFVGLDAKLPANFRVEMGNGFSGRIAGAVNRA